MPVGWDPCTLCLEALVWFPHFLLMIVSGSMPNDVISLKLRKRKTRHAMFILSNPLMLFVLGLLFCPRESNLCFFSKKKKKIADIPSELI